eukprot:Amastigsp_a842163_35.p5 type:complete len:103 gc:universal Amastigsp_a842163_35:1116-808(-)
MGAAMAPLTRSVFDATSAWRIESSIENDGPPATSVPRPTQTPAACARWTSSTPDISEMFELAQCARPALRSAIRLSSESERCTPCASTVLEVSSPAASYTAV